MWPRRWSLSVGPGSISDSSTFCHCKLEGLHQPQLLPPSNFASIPLKTIRLPKQEHVNLSGDIRSSPDEVLSGHAGACPARYQNEVWGGTPLLCSSSARAELAHLLPARSASVKVPKRIPRGIERRRGQSTGGRIRPRPCPACAPARRQRPDGPRRAPGIRITIKWWRTAITCRSATSTPRPNCA